MRRAISIIATAIALCVSETAAADEPKDAGSAGTGQKVTAEDLFQQGIALVEQGKWAEAAAKLEESNRLDPAPGTIINLADCYEHQGKLASAWTLFLEAASVFGRRSPPDARAETARSRADRLYPKLSRLTIDVPDAVKATAGLTVKRDGQILGAAQFGTAIAVDAGTHKIEVSAPGKRGWSKDVKIEGDGPPTGVVVPALEDDTVTTRGPALPAPPKVVPQQTPTWSWQKKAAVGGAAAGTLGIVVGAVFGGVAIGQDGQLDKGCASGNPRLCTPESAQILSDLRTTAAVSTAGFAVGSALLAAGVVLWLTAPAGDSSGTPSDKTSPAMARVWLTPVFGSDVGLASGVTW